MRIHGAIWDTENQSLNPRSRGTDADTFLGWALYDRQVLIRVLAEQMRIHLILEEKEVIRLNPRSRGTDADTCCYSAAVRYASLS